MTDTNNNVVITPTIYALSSASGKAGVSVIRVSGPKSWDTLKIFNKKVKYPEPRHSFVMTLKNPYTGDDIDNAMVIGFKSSQSFTGEDVIEYHCHGSQAVLSEVFDILSKIEGFRMAEHGEYTRRAFENGKMDLTEAEAIADLIDAETKAQKDQALAQMGGALANLYNGWAKDLTKILAYIEAVIDFPDEEVPDDEIEKVLPQLKTLERQINAHLNDNRQGERLRNGVKIAIIGAPNAGKSTLMNKLAQRDVAIVSDMAGTTRDIIEVHLNIAGYPVIIADTAGLRPELIGTDGHDAIEGEGMRRALNYAKTADIKLLLFDGENTQLHQNTLDLAYVHNQTQNPKDHCSPIGIGNIDKIKTGQNNANSLSDASKLKIADNVILAVNKSDLNSNFNKTQFKTMQVIDISAKNDVGIDILLKKIAELLKNQIFVSRETVFLTRNRHRENIVSMHQNIITAFDITEPELLAQELRFALYSIGRITGKIDVEDLLDVIFKDFCIGK